MAAKIDKDIIYLIAMLLFMIALSAGAMYIRYSVNDSRFPDAPTWTKFL